MNLAFSGKKVLVRVDFNVPLDANHQVTDDTRITKALPTIKYLLEQNTAVILMSHLGRPQKKLKADGSIDVEKYSLKHLLPKLSELLGQDVKFASSCTGGAAKMAAEQLSLGEVLLLENTRFHPEEAKGDELFAAGLSNLADIYVNDAFGTAHRAHASTTTVAKYFKKDEKCFGFLIDAEMSNAKKIQNSPSRPYTAIIGGAKVSDKIKLLDALIEKVQYLIIGGGMAYTFIKAQDGSIGNSLCEDEHLDTARELLEKARDNNVDIYLPEDSVIAERFDNDAPTQIVDSNKIPDGWMGLDIGPKAIAKFDQVIWDSQTILWNGPLGVFEMSNFSEGTFSIAKSVAKATKSGAYSLIGGGDSVAAINKANLGDQVSFVSTGGGAMLEFLEGKTLPGIKAILTD